MVEKGRRRTARGVGRFRSCTDAGSAAHGAGADQVADRDRPGSPRRRLWAANLIAPEEILITSGGAGSHAPGYTSALILIPFILFELWVHANITRHLRLDRDLPVLQASLGVVDLACRPSRWRCTSRTWGTVEALGFVMPFVLFHLHHSFDAAARFLAIDLHWLRCGRRAVLHGDVFPSGRRRPIRRPISGITPRAA